MRVDVTALSPGTTEVTVSCGAIKDACVVRVVTDEANDSQFITKRNVEHDDEERCFIVSFAFRRIEDGPFVYGKWTADIRFVNSSNVEVFSGSFEISADDYDENVICHVRIPDELIKPSSGSGGTCYVTLNCEKKRSSFDWQISTLPTSGTAEDLALFLDRTSAALEVGGTVQLRATARPANAVVSWSSSNTSVAKVSSSGLVTAVGAGAVIITASTDFASVSCSITVQEKKQLTKSDLQIKLIIPTVGGDNWYAKLEVSNYTSDPITVSGGCGINGYAVWTKDQKGVTVNGGKKVTISFYNIKYIVTGEINKTMYFDNSSTGYVVIEWNDTQYYSEYSTNGIFEFYRGNVNGPA